MPATESPNVVLKNRPVWMSDFLAEQIAKTARPAGTHSAFDHQLLVDTVALLRANPWIRDVRQVRRAYGRKPGVIEAPPETGVRWGGEDLQAGLDLVKLLFAKPYAEEIEKVDVSNFARRKDPKGAQIVLITKYNTEVRWGEPTDAGDTFFAEVTPAQKLAYMKAMCEQYGQVDAHYKWVDIRFDGVTYPPAAGSGSAQTAGADLQR